MVKLDRIYTRGGDKGQTSLGDGRRVPKQDVRVAAYGTFDEANALLGLARQHTTGADDEILARIQNDLFDLGADLCTPHDGRRTAGALRITPEQVRRLETEIDRMNDALQPLTSFILPGGSIVSSYLHAARTVVRRAERLVAELADREEVNAEALAYANRLSDHLFVMARWLNDRGAGDVLWTPGGTRNDNAGS